MNIPTYVELYDLAYIRGSWTCPKCGYTLTKRTMNVSQGGIGTSEDDRQSEICPNDGEWMEPATYQSLASELSQRILDLSRQGSDAHNKTMNYYDLDGALIRWDGRMESTPELYQADGQWVDYPHAPKVFASGTRLEECPEWAR